MKILRTLLFILICAASYMECSENQGISDNNENENISLAGTQWKLVAFVDIQTGESIEPEPKDCNTCYTLEFDSDTTAIGWSVANELYFIVTRSNIYLIFMTEVWDRENGNVNLFYEALRTLDTYEYSEDELKIYYEGKKKYLFYKPLLQLAGTQWKLAAFVDGMNGVSKTPEPEDDNSYRIIFKDDSTFLARSSTNDLVGKYKLNVSSSTISITELGGTKINELFDGRLFVERLLSLQHYAVEEGFLRLYYNETDYLLFNPEPEFVNPYRETVVGKWKLIQISTVYDSGAHNPEIIDCSSDNIIYAN
jgi:hypothetical protein